MDVGFYFKLIDQKMKSRVNNMLKEYDLTQTQIRILFYLNENSGRQISQKDICDFLMVKHTSLIDVLKRLENKGFIERGVNKDNARLNCVSITDSGLQVIEKAALHKQETESIITRGMTQSDKEQLVYYLKLILSNIEGDD
ncbi:MAG: MarR family winged helix-turn-helix transcriptional regulator [Acutalibacteraceae bacterium]